jgi:hypothetical protein
MQDGAHFTATQLLEINECFCVHPVLYNILQLENAKLEIRWAAEYVAGK